MSRPSSETVIHRQDGKIRSLNTIGSDAVLRSEVLASKVTSRSQTTLPSGVRKALGLKAGDQIAYSIQGDQAIIRKVSDEDPALSAFLDLLERDIAENGQRAQFATRAFAEYLEELTAGIEVDYDAPIEGDFQL
jgi:antitoxin PrlF